MRRRRTSRWLAAAEADRGLLIPGAPGRRACDLLLASAFAAVTADDVAVTFPWDDRGASNTAGSEDRWNISSWKNGRAGPIGVGVAVGGRYVEATKEIRRRRRSLVNRLDRMFADGVVVPLCVGLAVSVDADRAAVSVLCRVLAERPELRARLDDAERVRLLAADLTSQAHGEVPSPVGGRRRTVEILAALRALGYEHHLGGRPLPDEAIPTVDELAPKVFCRVRSSPYAQDVDVDEATVRDIVNRFYVAVAPWPFKALMDPRD